MKYKNMNSTATISVVSAVLFIAFTYCYLYFFQADLLILAQHIWSGGKTHYNPTVGAIIITSILFVIQIGVKGLSLLPVNLRNLTYFPSFLFLGVLTSMSPESSMSVGLWGWITPLLIILYFLILRPLRELASLETKHIDTSLISRTAWSNHTILAIMMLMTLSISNKDIDLHQHIYMEQKLAARDYKAVIDAKQEHPDSSLTMIRALALSKKGLLGESLFNYPLIGGSSALIPTADKSCRFMLGCDSILWRQLGGVPRPEDYSIGTSCTTYATHTQAFLHKLRRQHIARPAVSDYILCSYLLDRDLDGFVREIISLNDSIVPDSLNKHLSTLPRHYREALVLYTHTRSSRLLTYTDDVLDTDYDDFVAVLRKNYSTKTERHYAIKQSHSGTYWAYYRLNE